MEPRKFYDRTADSYEKRQDNTTTKYMRKKEEELIRKYVSGRTLDMGCGTGCHLKLIKNSIGIDFSLNMLKKADGDVVQAEAEILPFKDESFDTLICFFSVLNFADPEKTVKEMGRVLKKDGAVLLSLSSVWDMYDGFFLRKIFPREKCKKKIRIEGARVVFNLYRKKDIIDLFSDFKLVEFSSLFITQKPYWGWYRDFSGLDKFRLKIDRVMPKKMGRIYFFVFRKTGN